MENKSYKQYGHVRNYKKIAPEKTSKKEKVTPYLRGPIPIWWLRRAYKQCKLSVEVGISLWHYRALMKSEEFSVTCKKISEVIGLSRQQTLRGIKELEKTKLIKVKRKRGSKSTFKLITKNPESDSQKA